MTLPSPPALPLQTAPLLVPPSPDFRDHYVLYGTVIPVPSKDTPSGKEDTRNFRKDALFFAAPPCWSAAHPGLRRVSPSSGRTARVQPPKVITVHRSTSHHSTSQYIAVHHITSHHGTSHYITSQYIAVHRSTLQYIMLYDFVLYGIMLRVMRLCFIA